MEKNGHIQEMNSSDVLFHWRIPDDKDPGEGKTGRFEEEWRKHDKLIALILCLALTKIYDCDQCNVYTEYFQSYQTRCIELILFAVITMAAYAVLKVRNPDIFYYKEDTQHHFFLPRQSPPPPVTDSSDKPRSAYTQTDTRNYTRETRILQRRHRREMVKLERMNKLMRRKLSHQWKEANKVLNDKRQTLADLQLQLLPLNSQKAALLADKEALEIQLKEERRRYDDLVTRFDRIQQQKSQVGTVSMETAPVQRSVYPFQNGIKENKTSDRVPDIINKTSIDIGGGDAVNYDGNHSAEVEGKTCATQSLTVIQARDTIDSNHSILPDSTTQTDHQSMKPVRILYATESGPRGSFSYRQVTPDVYHVYTEGAGLLPSNAIGQMEVVAQPQTDGTLKLQYVKQYVAGFPVDRLKDSDLYQSYEEFRQSLGTPVPTNWSPCDVQFLNPLDDGVSVCTGR